jgi:hypothetical protein
MSTGDEFVDHGLVFEFHDNGVDLIDTWVGVRVRLTLDEYEAFHQGVLAGEFDLDVLRARAERPDT